MTREDTLRAVDAAFGGWPTPARVTDDVSNDPERGKIESDFSGKPLDTLTYNECSMLLTDGALVTRDAFFYFLPRLAKAVLREDGDWVLLGLRLEALGAEGLTPEQATAVARLQSELAAIEGERED